MAMAKFGQFAADTLTNQGKGNPFRRTGMSREALSRLENHRAPNPTVRTLARYAAAVGLELHLTAKRPRGG